MNIDQINMLVEQKTSERSAKIQRLSGLLFAIFLAVLAPSWVFSSALGLDLELLVLFKLGLEFMLISAFSGLVLNCLVWAGAKTVEEGGIYLIPFFGLLMFYMLAMSWWLLVFCDRYYFDVMFKVMQ